MPIKLANNIELPKYFSKCMKKYIVYIITDANRIYLHADVCQDLSIKLYELQNATSTLFLSGPKYTRIIHTEEFEHKDDAERRASELNSFTRMQKEKLIRKNNPNWLSIHNIINIKDTKKAVAYA